jgi:hypothetical protein
MPLSSQNAGQDFVFRRNNIFSYPKIPAPTRFINSRLERSRELKKYIGTANFWRITKRYFKNSTTKQQLLQEPIDQQPVKIN